MSELELAEIVAGAEAAVHRYLSFDPEAVKKLTRLAEGHPYMVHLIGKYAFRRAWRTSQREIHPADIQATLEDVASSRQIRC
jgi:hypothetical protein